MGRPVGARTAKEVLCEGNPVRNLWMAVIIKSWRDLKLRKKLRQKIYNKEKLREDEQEKIYNMVRARFFFFSDQSNFPWICEQLSLSIGKCRVNAQKRLKQNNIDYATFINICSKRGDCDMQQGNQCPDAQCQLYEKLDINY
jgi:hypothetical protein